MNAEVWKAILSTWRRGRGHITYHGGLENSPQVISMSIYLWGTRGTILPPIVTGAFS
jgi:hypothetical protein